MSISKLIHRVKNSIWLYPTIISLSSFLLAFAIYFADKSFSARFVFFIPEVFRVPVTLARNIHSIIATAFITITTFTFSTTMVVLTMYTSQLSPRVVENFLANKSTMRSFAVFVGGFVFSMLSLLLSSNISPQNQVISATFSAVYIVVGLNYFLRFIHNVAIFIQTGNVIERLYDEAKSNIKMYINIVKNYEIHSENDFTIMPCIKRIVAKRSTYIQNINFTKLKEIAEKSQSVIVFEKTVGEFVHKDEILVSLHAEECCQLPDGIESKVRACYLVGDQRTENQDFNYSLQKIVEVALKALSPGINDPNTAIHCIRVIGIVLEDLIQLKSGYVFMNDDEDCVGLVYEIFDLNSLLDVTYSQIVHYGSADASVMLALIKSLSSLMLKATTDNQISIINYTDYIWDKLSEKITVSAEKKRLRSAMTELKSYVDA